MKTDVSTRIATTAPAHWADEMARKYGAVPVSDNALTVLSRRYLKKDKDGKPVETPQGMYARVAWNVASADCGYGAGEDEVARVAERFYVLMTSGRFLPNSPTLMNAGRELQQLSACFVLPVEDSMESIFEAVKNTALIHKSGGGTGFSFSRLRPRGDRVGSTAGVSSGPISFMKVFDAATEHVKQGGTRRGANMGILRVDHPDILDFIDCKQDKTQLTNFNISVAITEEFMSAVAAGAEYALYSPRDGKQVGKLNAVEVFEKIVSAAWRDGEPGIVFIDRINRDNPTPHVGMIESTNPCGEQPLLGYESCNLGSLNLGRHVRRNGDGSVEFDYEAARETVRTAVHFLDNVIDMNRYPIPQISEMTLANRKIGLGVMGWADLLAMLGVAYDSDEAVALAREVMGFVHLEAVAASEDLAGVRGAFPNFAGSKFDIPGGRKRRNATVTTIAPTGTISIIADAASGIEPYFALSYIRNVMDNDHLVEVNPLFEAAVRSAGAYSNELMRAVSEKGSCRSFKEIPERVRKSFSTAHDISPEAHLKMQAAFQEFTDNAVSKTVNFHSDATVEDVRKVYELAYELGCKGVTVYRDKSREGQVLNIGAVNVKGAAAPAAPEKSAAEAACEKLGIEFTEDGHVRPRPRPETLTGITREMRTSCGSLYVTINRDEKGIFEVFGQMGKAGGCAASQSEALGRVVSMAMRAGTDPHALVKQLKGINCHKPCGFGENQIGSCADALAKAVEWYLDSAEPVMSGSGVVNFPAEKVRKPAAAVPAVSEPAAGRGACPDCGSTVELQEGCLKCRSCGYSEC